MTDGGRMTVVVSAASAGQRLDRFVATLPSLPTRSQAKQLIDDGHVSVDGVPRKPSFALPEGAIVVVESRPLVPLTIEPEALPLDVLFEDADLLAIDKPPGMAAHPAAGSPNGTVVNAVLHRLGRLDGVGDPDRPGIVHRLDKDTSGVMLIARTATALAALGRQFHDRTVAKTYVAVVAGCVDADRGRIDRPIGRHPTERKKMSVHTHRGRAAVTDWVVLERFAAATFLELRPGSGRTHQIRVHLASLGHPIMGDLIYGGRRAQCTAIARQALHAAALSFDHPTTGERISLRAPWPADLLGLLATLRGPNGAKGDENP